jgi:Lrp/AsnC family leucine-responsive transcriptional regulator
MPVQRSFSLVTKGSTSGSARSLNELKVAVDDMDWALLRELQADARLSYSELSRRVHLSPPAVAERVRRLEEAGVVTGYHAHVDLTKAGRHVVAIIRMACYGARCVLRDPEVAAWPEVLEIHRVTGDACCVLKVATGAMEDFEKIIDRLAPYGQPSSTMVLSSPLNWRPVNPTP